MNGTVGCFSGLRINRFRVRTTRVDMNSGLLVANPAAKTLCVSLSRIHCSLRPISAMQGKVHISFGIPRGVHPGSGLCGVMGGGRGRWRSPFELRRYIFLEGGPCFSVGGRLHFLSFRCFYDCLRDLGGLFRVGRSIRFRSPFNTSHDQVVEGRLTREFIP